MKTEELLLEMAKQEEIKNKKIMTAMWILLITSSIFYTITIILAITILEKGFVLGSIIFVSTLLFMIVAFISLKLEVDAGYYECKNCHHKYIPNYSSVLWAPHMSTTRYLKCPKCNKRTWSKKIMTK